MPYSLQYLWLEEHISAPLLLNFHILAKTKNAPEDLHILFRYDSILAATLER